MATMGELSTVLALEDAYLIVEVAAVDAYNNRPPERGVGEGRR